MTTVKQVFTGDASQLQREYEKLAKSVATLEGKMGQAAKASERAAAKSEDLAGSHASLNGAIKQVQQLAMSYLTYEAAISAANAELEIQNRLQTQAFDKQIGVAQSQASLALNTLDDTEFRRAVGEVDKIATAEVFPDRAKLVAATAEAISAAGGDLELALRGVRTAAGLAKVTPEVLRPLTGATIDTARASGASTDEAAALVLSAGKTGRVVDPRQQADVLGKGIGGIVASSRGERRTSAEQAAELIAALTVSMGDKMGDRSTTAAMSLSGQLDKFFSEGYEVELGGKKFKRKPAQDPGGVLDRVAALQQDAKLRDQFLKNAHFEAGAESIIKRIIREPEGQEARTLADARKTVGYDTRVLDQAKESLARGTPQLELANQDAGLNVREDSRQLGDPRALVAQAKKIREELYGYQQYSPRFGFQQMAENALNDLTRYDPIGATIRDVESRIDAVRAPKSLLGGRDQLTPFRKPESQLTTGEREDLAALRKILADLKNLDRKRNEIEAERDKPSQSLGEQNQLIREQTQAIREQTQVIQQGQRNDSPPSPLIPSDAARGMRGVSRER